VAKFILKVPIKHTVRPAHVDPDIVVVNPRNALTVCKNIVTPASEVRPFGDRLAIEMDILRPATVGILAGTVTIRVVGVRRRSIDADQLVLRIVDIGIGHHAIVELGHVAGRVVSHTAPNHPVIGVECGAEGQRAGLRHVAERINRVTLCYRIGAVSERCKAVQCVVTERLRVVDIQYVGNLPDIAIVGRCERRALWDRRRERRSRQTIAHGG